MVVKCETLNCLDERGALLIELLSGDYDETKLPTTAGAWVGFGGGG